jgi:phosphatidylglycerol:prolipoprotein diacylglycerol transferase
MWQTFFTIPSHVAGMPVFGLGLALAVWTLFSVALVAWLAWRQGFNADTLGYLPLLVIVAGVILWLLPAISQEPRGLRIHGYGVMILLAVTAGTGLAVWRGRRVGVDPEVILSLAFWMILPAIVGARVFYVTEYWSEQFWPVYGRQGLAALLGAVVNVARGGLVIYGGFFGGVVGLLAFYRKYRLPLLATADLVAPSLMLGLAIGRIGCLLNGCCYGGLCALPWAVTFPAGPPSERTPPYASQVARGVMYGFALSGDPQAAPTIKSVQPHSQADEAGLRPGDRLLTIGDHVMATAGVAHDELTRLFEGNHPVVLGVEDKAGLNKGIVRLSAIAPPPRSLPVHPTQLYSSIGALLICLLLLAYDPFRRRDGELWALMLTVYAVTRFLEEVVRTDEPPILGTGMTVSQNVSLLLLLVGMGLWYYVLHRPEGVRKGLGIRD